MKTTILDATDVLRTNPMVRQSVILDLEMLELELAKFGIDLNPEYILSTPNGNSEKTQRNDVMHFMDVDYCNYNGIAPDFVFRTTESICSDAVLMKNP